MTGKMALQSGDSALARGGVGDGVALGRGEAGAGAAGGVAAAAAEAVRWDCPVAKASALFSDRWAAPILFALSGAVERGERSERLRRGLAPVSRKVFTETIRELERNGFVERDIAPTVPPQVTYRITPLGLDLLAFLRTLVAWHEEHDGEIEAARARFAESRVG